MKKLIAIAAVSTLVLAACAQPAPAPAPSPAPGAEAPGDNGADTAAEIEWPTSPVTLNVAFGAGGGTDLSARAFQAVAPQYFNDQAFTVVNTTGGGGAVWFTQGAIAEPTGYDVTISTAEIVTLPLLQDVAFNPEDFEHVALFNFAAAAITVPADSPFDTLEAFLDHARENPGEVRVGNSGINAIWDLHTHALASAVDVQFNHVPYDGAAPAIAALMGGEVDAVAVSAAEVSTQVNDGLFRMLAVSASERLEAFPEVPTYAELGINIPNIGAWRGLSVPSGTPAEVVAEFARRAEQVILSQEFYDIMTTQDLTVNFMNAEDFSAYVQEQQVFFANLVEEAGLAD